MTTTIARRGFLGILAGAIAGPSIIKISNLMPIKVTDINHMVRITGFDHFGHEISEYVRIVETLKDGVDMLGYSNATKLIQPRFSSVQDITWTKDLLRSPSAFNGNVHSDFLKGRIYHSRTNFIQPDAPPIDIPRYGLAQEHYLI